MFLPSQELVIQRLLGEEAGQFGLHRTTELQTSDFVIIVYLLGTVLGFPRWPCDLGQWNTLLYPGYLMSFFVCFFFKFICL